MSNELRTMLLESLEKVFQSHCTPERIQERDQGGYDPDLWQVIEELGFHLAGVEEDQGGAGASVADQVALLRSAGYHAAPIPLAETMFVGHWLLASAGMELPAGSLSVGPALPGEELLLNRSDGQWTLSGSLQRIAWPAESSRFVGLGRLEDRYYVLCMAPDACRSEPVFNLAGESRATLDFTSLRPEPDQVRPAPADLNPRSLAQRSALARAALITGALDKALELAVQYAGERKQFGRAIGKFQAIQQQLAIAAAEVAAAKAMTDQAAMNLDRGSGGQAAAAAKIRAGQAAGLVAKIVHQVHGAMGFTQEYPLHHATRRLWAWREENGTERYWSEQLGRTVAENGADNLWPMITGMR